LIGDEFGLHRELAKGKLTVGELARRTSTSERYVREWLGEKGRFCTLCALICVESIICMSIDRPFPGVLASALEGFSPTPEFPEIEEAQALLSALPYEPIKGSADFRVWHSADVPQRPSLSLRRAE
jgi:hypothetical protein